MSRPDLLLLLSCVVALPVLAQSASTPPGVRIYRCVDATGKQTLRDTPCRKGETVQQVRDMLKPRDAPARPRAPVAAPAHTGEPVRVLVVTPPQPLYECVDDEGRRYTSDDGHGNPRWVPLWVAGYPPMPPRTSLGSDVGASRGVTSMSASVGRPMNYPPVQAPLPPLPPPHGPGHGYGYGAPMGGGVWVRDTCHVLPPSETCARLRDRQDEIRRRRFNAQENERNALAREERGIAARLANDCGGA